VAEKKASRKRASSPSQRRHYLLVGAVVVLAAATVALLALLGQGGVSGEDEVQELLADIPQNGTTLGSEDAPVTIRLYEDLQCPACAGFARETFPGVVTRYVEPGEARVVSQTLTVLGPDSVPAAEAALAAGEQDRYWEYSMLFFSNQGQENSGYVTDEFLTGIAEMTRGLDVDRWNQARGSGSAQAEIEAARSRAEDEGVEGTPTLVIEGPGGTRELVGAVPLDRVSAAMDEVKGP
jgi:protein-disulfide isomerase